MISTPPGVKTFPSLFLFGIGGGIGFVFGVVVGVVATGTANGVTVIVVAAGVLTLAGGAAAAPRIPRRSYASFGDGAR